MTIEQLRQIQQQVMALVAGARSGVAALQSRVDSIWGDTDRLTPEARRSDVALALGEGRTSIEGMLQDEARGALNMGYAQIGGADGRGAGAAGGE